MNPDTPMESTDSKDHLEEEKDNETTNSNAEEKANSSGNEMDEVQSFCAEFQIKVENAAGIRPWLQFSDTNFPGKTLRKVDSLLIERSPILDEVLKLFEESEFDMPTPIQSIAWPILSQKRDLVGIASTGSGKTLAVRNVSDALLVLSLLRLVHPPSRLSHS